MEHLRQWMTWMLARPWSSITEGILLCGAIGGAVRWWYQIKKLRRGNKEADEERAITEMLVKIEALDKKTRGGLQTVPRAEEGENQEIVNRAWERFVKNRRPNATGRF